MSFHKKGKSGAQKLEEKKIEERKANEGKQLLIQCFEKKAASYSEERIPRQGLNSRSPSPNTENASERWSTNCLRIVLVGHSGSGKTATGNTILNKEAFNSHRSMASVASSCQKEEGFVNGTPVAVVDTPGIFDTKLSIYDVNEEILNWTTLLSPGPHVFLLVLRIVGFIRNETEMQTLNLIKETLGENAGMFGIIIFTHGDQLHGQTIESYLERIDSQMKKLIRDFRGRYHVIDNKNREDKYKQVVVLLEKINRIVEKNGGGCYTHEMFKEAEAARNKTLKEEMKREKKMLQRFFRDGEGNCRTKRDKGEREWKVREEQLKIKVESLLNELKKRDAQEEKEKKERQKAEEQRRIEEESKKAQWEKLWQKTEDKRMKLEEERQKRDQEFRERREMEELHKERLKREYEEEYQKRLAEERSGWELKEKKMIKEFEQDKREREEKEKERIEKECKERERIEKEYENSKIEMRKQKQEWEKAWKEEWDKRVEEEKKRREEQREKLNQLEEEFERERKEEKEKRKREDQARREQEERERKEMEDEYKNRLREMKKKYEDEARKRAGI